MPSFVPHPRPAPKKRNLKKVPYVELFDGRLQGVVSSGSDPKRVYVSFFTAGSGDYGCATNNNRPCGGLRGSPCTHLDELVKNAIDQFGAERVQRYLQLADPPRNGWDIARQTSGSATRESTGLVFARFLDYLRYLELEPPQGELPEMAWFVTGA